MAASKAKSAPGIAANSSGKRVTDGFLPPRADDDKPWRRAPRADDSNVVTHAFKPPADDDKPWRVAPRADDDGDNSTTSKKNGFFGGFRPPSAA